MRKSKVVQELVNIYPPWSKVRSDDQSIGFQILNAASQSIERMDKQLDDQENNNFLTTANVNEIDLLHRVDLPANFEFAQDTTDPTNPTPINPMVSGLVIDDLMSGYVPVTVAELNDVETFWYTSVPNRMNLSIPVSGVSHILYTGTSNEDFPYSGELLHHLEGGTIWIETESGTQYIKQNDLGGLDRASIVLTGTTRKGTEETETFIFPWDQKQKSKKEWKAIERVDLYNIEDGVRVQLRSADFNNQPHLEHYNLKYSNNRNKIDEFYGLSSDGHYLDRIGYISDEWQQIMLGFSDTEIKERWELLDSNMNTVSGVDMALEPYSNRAWVTTSSGIIHCYDTDEFMISGVNYLDDRTPGAEVQMEFSERRLVLGEEIRFTPSIARPLQEVTKYRVWYKTPSGAKFGLKDGNPVAFSSNFWAYPENMNDRALEPEIVLVASERGEYVFCLESTMVDETTWIDKQIVMVQFKQPLKSINVASQLAQPIQGIDFDSDQQMYLKTALYYYPVKLSTDVMIIDYDNKVIYLHEEYDSIKVDN